MRVTGSVVKEFFRNVVEMRGLFGVEQAIDGKSH
jgi:hypothetical protein